MAALPPSDRRKLAAFVAIVVSAMVLIWVANRRTRDRDAGISQYGGADLVRALQYLATDRANLSMVMGQGFFSERQARHIYAELVGPVDVLVLGQSDADHISETSFRPGVRFYNGFLSNSHLVYQEEVLAELVAHTHHVPRLILVDLRAPFFLREGDEPGQEIPRDQPRFTNQWGGPWGSPPKPPPWYSDIDSMLSLQQTELTLDGMGIHFESLFGSHGDTPAAFTVVPRSQTVDAFRFLGDGSRVYPREANGALVPRGVRAEDPAEMVRPNANRLTRLVSFLKKLSAGSTVVAYTPPMKASAFKDERRARLQAGVLDQISRAAGRLGVEYCNLSHSAVNLGCAEADFYDELHLSRACDDHILHALAQCAPRAAPILREVLVDAK